MSGASTPAPAAAVEPLLSEDGDITDKVRHAPAHRNPRSKLTSLPCTQFEAVLQQVFRRYASTLPSASSPDPTPTASTDIFSNTVTLSRSDLNRFASDTNGQRAFLSSSGTRWDGGADAGLAAMTDETFEEISTFLDMVESRLTFKGFLQLYQLQTGSSSPLSSASTKADASRARAENDEEETRNDLTAWGFTPDLELVETRKGDSEVDEGVRPALESLTGLGLGGEKKEKEVEA